MSHSNRFARLFLFGAVSASVILTGCNNDDPAKSIAAAQSAYDKRDWATAAIEAKSAVQKAPDSVPARLLLGRILLEQGDLAGAEAELRKIYAPGSNDAEVLPLLARAARELAGPAKFMDEFGSKQISDARAQAELNIEIGRAQLALGKPDEALQRFDQSLSVIPDQPDALLGKAMLRLAANDQAGALALAEQALAKHAQHLPALLMKAEILLVKGERDAALQALETAKKARPEDPRAAAREVSLYMGEGKLVEAEAALKALRATAPNTVQAAYLESSLALRKGDFRAARDAANKILRGQPNHVQALMLAAVASLRLGEQLQAQAMLEKVIGQARDWPMPRKLLAESYLNVRNAPKALEAIEPLLRAPTPDAETLSLAGLANLAQGDYAKAADYFERVLKLKPDNAVARTQLGLSRMASGDEVRALQDLEAAAKLDSTRFQAELAIVASHLRKGDTTKALAAVAELEKKMPGSVQTYLIKAQTLVAAKRHADARVALDRALQIEPNNLGAVSMLAGLDMQENKPAEARKRFEQLIAADAKNVGAYLQLAQLQASTGAAPNEIQQTLEKAVSADPSRSEARLALINLLLRQGDSKAALGVAQQAQAANPDSPEVLRLLGATQRAAGDAAQAVASFGKLHGLLPNDPGVLLQLADAQRVSGDNASAERSLRKALELKHDFAEGSRALVALLLSDKQYDAALAVARDAQKANLQSPFGFVLEADTYMAQKQWGSAVTALQQAQKRAPQPVIAIGLANAYEQQGKAADAKQVVDDWIKQNPRDVAVRNYLAEKALAGKNYAQALDIYKTIHSITPNQPQILNNLAWVANKQGDPKAVEYAEAALRATPKAPAVQETVGTVLVERGQVERGVALLKEAAAGAPKSPQIQLGLARGLARAGDKEGARKAASSAAEQAAGNAPLLQEIEAFSKTL